MRERIYQVRSFWTRSRALIGVGGLLTGALELEAMKEQIQKRIEKAAEERYPYTQAPIGEHHLVHRAEIETKRAIYIQGANLLLPLLMEARETLEKCRDLVPNNLMVLEAYGHRFVPQVIAKIDALGEE